LGRIITLLTDFGLEDGYVGSLKGIILGICPAARIIDITHLVPPQDIRAGGFILLTVYRDFPAGTIHLAVVDPDVGTERCGLVIQTSNYLFVGPDNGLFSWVLKNELDAEVRQLENPEFWRPTVSSTFHGRDLFAPVAAHLATGVPAAALGPRRIAHIAEWSTISRHGSSLKGEVLHVDHFGNVITNLDRKTLNDFAPYRRLVIEAGGRTIGGLRTTYGSEPAGVALAVIGSHGFLEIAVNRGSAARLLDLGAGDTVLVGVSSEDLPLVPLS
jgi:S-adenosyl-L-methionine hydrolase (adenosine-forming)